MAGGSYLQKYCTRAGPGPTNEFGNQIQIWLEYNCFNTLRPRQNGRHFADDIFKCIFLNENVWIPVKISLKYVPKGPINNIPALVQIMAWRRSGDKPLSEPMMVDLPTHICVIWPQWVDIFSVINLIIAKFCAYQDSCAVLVCAKFCCDQRENEYLNFIN